MRVVDEKPETIHLYVVREENPRPSIFPIILSAVTLFVLVVVGVVFPYRQPEERKTIRIPAVFLPLQSFNASVGIIPTGVKIYAATIATGKLTVYNGSVFAQEIPKSMILTSHSGIEVVTDNNAFVPAGNPPNFGIGTLSAHAAEAGDQGNIEAQDINVVYGSAIYIRNLQAFHGGKNSYSVKVETQQDRQTARDGARAILAAQESQIKVFLANPCHESTLEKNAVLRLSWQCQFVTYSVLPYMHITRIRLVGKNLLIDFVFAARPRILQFK